MDLSALPRASLRVLAQLRQRARVEAGFTLIEAVIAMAIFLGVATALAGVLTSSISARSNASERTAGEQVANTQLEWIRSLDYADVGLTTDANPRGIVEADGDQSGQGGPTVPVLYTVAIDIYWVDDRVPTAIDTKASYKNVIVTVSRARDGKVLSTQSTQIGPRQRAAFGGIDKGIVNAMVVDFLTNAPFSSTLVRLSNGPSSPLGDLTRLDGTVRFPALAATGSAYYDLVIPPFNGYIQLPDPSVTHFQLAAGATPSLKVLQVYKPVTFTADFRNSNGTAYVGTVQFTVTNSRGSKAYTYTGTPVTVANITNSSTGATELLVPASYTITVTNQAAALFYTDPVVQDVPSNLSNYPNTLNGNITVTADPLGTISATVTSAGGPVAGATVTVSGGPRSIAPRTATTNASGVAPSFTNLPAGPGYTVSAAKGGQSAPNQTPSVSGGSTTNLSFDFPVGHLKAVVTWAGLNVVNATVTLTGGPAGLSLSGTSLPNGEVTFSNVPAGSGYTMIATAPSGQSVSANPTVVGGTTTTVPMALPTISLVATVTWAGFNVSGAQVTLSGGPMSLSAVSATTLASGQVTFSPIPPGSGYTLAATKNGQTKTLTSQTFATSPTTSQGIPLPTGTITVNAATWAGKAASGASVTISGGPDTPNTYTGTTDASGVVSIVVPATTSANPYTVSVSKNGGTGSAPVTSIASGATVTVAPTLTPTGTIAINAATWAGQPAGSATITISGGPNSPATYTGTANASGVVSIVVPATTSAYPYTVTASKNTGSGSVAVSAVGSGATVTVSTLALTQTGTISLTNTSLTWAGQFVPNANVTITGGPNAGATYSGTTSGTGALSVTVPATSSSFPYTVVVSKNTGSGTNSSVAAPATGSSTTATVSLTQTKVLTVTVPANSTVSITGGPNGTAGSTPQYTGATSGTTVAITVPMATGYTYTVRAYKTGCTGTGNKSGVATVSSAATPTTVSVSYSATACPGPTP